MKLIFSFQSNRFSTWPKSQERKLYILRTTRAFKVKWKIFFLVLHGFWVVKNLRPESVPLSINRIWQIICNYRTVDAALGLNPVRKLFEKFAGKDPNTKIWRATMWTELSRTAAFGKQQFSLLMTVVPFIAFQNIKKIRNPLESSWMSKILVFYVFFVYETSSMLLGHLYNVFYVFNTII